LSQASFSCLENKPFWKISSADMTSQPIIPNPQSLIVPRRTITGSSAILLPFLENHAIDWQSFDDHVERTCQAGLIPAVNMDTGYANLIDEATRREVLQRTQRIAGESGHGTGYVAGAFVADSPGDAFNLDAYSIQIELIQSHAGIPVIFQTYGLTGQSDEDIVASYHSIAQKADPFVAFELGNMFAPFGSIYSLDVYEGLMSVKQCIGAKHSSLSRELEWQRIALRNEVRPDFKVFTGNDLAIDMVVYGSDYLLGLSTFCPDWFAMRDQLWESGDSRFYQLNDILQYLGFFAFRDPVPAYKHSAAMFLKSRGWLKTDLTHPQSATRPETDVEHLQKILTQARDFLAD
jgi:dihydrodipicolinate synthase/N-acetylneuraminate lyase